MEFEGKKFIKGDFVEIEHLKDNLVIVHRDMDNCFASITGEIFWKSQVKSVQSNSIWSKIVWMFQ